MSFFFLLILFSLLPLKTSRAYVGYFNTKALVSSYYPVFVFVVILK